MKNEQQTTNNEQTTQLKLTIEIPKLTLADWLAIAEAKDNSPMWGFYAWLEKSDTDWKQLTRTDVEAIAKLIDKPTTIRRVNGISLLLSQSVCWSICWWGNGRGGNCVCC